VRSTAVDGIVCLAVQEDALNPIMGFKGRLSWVALLRTALRSVPWLYGGAAIAGVTVVFDGYTLSGRII